MRKREKEVETRLRWLACVFDANEEEGDEGEEEEEEKATRLVALFKMVNDRERARTLCDKEVEFKKQKLPNKRKKKRCRTTEER